jgi:hypothetical protein
MMGRVEGGAMTTRPDHELEVLEDDQTIPPRPEELIADLRDERPTEAPQAVEADESTR